jgi:hypothetical protein
MALVGEATWVDIEALRARFENGRGSSVEEEADRFAALFAGAFESIVLARVFLVVPFARLAPADRAFATALAAQNEKGDARITSSTPVLSLVASRGVESEWNDRRRSRGHLAIPLIDEAFVRSAPMLARLLADFEVDLAGLGEGRGITTRLLAGGRNGTFYVADAQTATDEQGRRVIANQPFVERYGVRTVFGMGGAYVDGTLAVAILFSREALALSTVDRFGSFISNFKIATMRLVMGGHLYRTDSPEQSDEHSSS